MESKTCKLCQLGIDDSKQFAEFIHYVNKDKIQSKAYYHVDCFRDKMLGSAKGQYLMSKANKLMDRAAEVIGVR